MTFVDKQEDVVLVRTEFPDDPVVWRKPDGTSLLFTPGRMRPVPGPLASQPTKK